MQAILEAHNAHTHWTVFQIRVTRLSNSVIVNINHVIKHAHCSAHGFLELLMIQNHLARSVRSHVRS